MPLQLKEAFRKSGTIKLNFPLLGLYYSVSKEDLTKRAEAGQLSDQIVNAFFDNVPEPEQKTKPKAKAKAD